MAGFKNGIIKASYTPYATIVGGTSSPGDYQEVDPGSAGEVLTSNGASTKPSMESLSGSSGLSGWTSFTPTIVGTTTAGAGTYAFRAASYALFGYTCFIKGALVWTAHTGTGNPAIGGLPFQPDRFTVYEFQAMRVQSVNWSSSFPLNGCFRVFVEDILHLLNNGGTASPFDTAATLWFSGFYQIDH